MALSEGQRVVYTGTDGGEDAPAIGSVGTVLALTGTGAFVRLEADDPLQAPSLYLVWSDDLTPADDHPEKDPA